MSDVMIYFAIIGFVVTLVMLGILIFRPNSSGISGYNGSAWPPMPPLPPKPKTFQAITVALYGETILDHSLQLLKIKGLRFITTNDEKIDTIINKYLPLGDIFECQRELIDAGYEDIAKL